MMVVLLSEYPFVLWSTFLPSGPSNFVPLCHPLFPILADQQHDGEVRPSLATFVRDWYDILFICTE